MADHSVEIAYLETILNAGSERQAVDGLSNQFDMAAIQKRLNELRRDDDATVTAGTYRKVLDSIPLNVSW